MIYFLILLLENVAMKRRTILKNAASTGLLAFGATAAVTASTGDDPKVAVLDEETREHVTMHLSETDVNTEDCCVDEGCSSCPCDCCLC